MVLFIPLSQEEGTFELERASVQSSMGGEITWQSHLVALEIPHQRQVLTPSETY